MFSKLFWFNTGGSSQPHAATQRIPTHPNATPNTNEQMKTQCVIYEPLKDAYLKSSRPPNQDWDCMNSTIQVAAVVVAVACCAVVDLFSAIKTFPPAPPMQQNTGPGLSLSGKWDGKANLKVKTISNLNFLYILPFVSSRKSFRYQSTDIGQRQDEVAYKFRMNSLEKIKIELTPTQYIFN